MAHTKYTLISVAVENDRQNKRHILSLIKTTNK